MNKPVAWIDYVEHSDFYDLNVSGRGIPLYTHPIKELTDEEMELAYYECFNLKNKMPDNEKRRSYFKFAKAILRKAQEK